MRRFASLLVAGVVVTGCALKGDVRRIENQLTEYREDTARADSARAVMLARLLDDMALLQGLSGRILDSLRAQNRSIFAMQGVFRGELTDIQRQLVAIQELTGQSQVRLGQLRDQIAQRSIGAPTQAAGTGGEGADTRVADAPGPEELFEMGIQQLNRGSPTTARIAFRRVLDDHAESARAADALYWIGESFRAEEPDSAVAAFEAVVERFPNSSRAPMALYKIGLDAERRGDEAAARLAFQRVVAGYPRSDEADLARDKLRQ
ncbi:MAG: tetratricopeptide repeat protein [Gemmatimonadetes bacterium]|nr:tetratricopeptide repeat protein [Gemmatimonadota bacterium]